jgi:hypothetical protein
MGVGNSSQNRKLLAIQITRVRHVLASYVSFRNGWNIEHMVLLPSELAMLKDIPEVHTSPQVPVVGAQLEERMDSQC